MRILIFLTLLLLNSCTTSSVNLDKYSNNYADRSLASDRDCTTIVTSLIHESKTTTSPVRKIHQETITLEEAETIKTYMFQGPILNFYLRNRKNPANEVMTKSMLEINNLDEQKVKKIVLDLDNLIEKYSRNEVSKIYYRGESRPNDGSVYVGARLQYDNYISTTRDRELAQGYARGNGDDSELIIIYEIKIRPGQLGLQINEIAPVGIRNQDEFLLARDGELIVEEINNVDGITHVKASYSKIKD